METDKSSRLETEIASALIFREVALGVFHQLLNLLHSASSELLLLDSLTQNQERLHRSICDVREFIRRAKSLLDFAQRGGTLQAEPEKCYLTTDIVRVALEQYSDKTKNLGISLDHSYGQCDFVICVQRAFLIQAVLALLDNAFWAIRSNKTTKRQIFVAVRQDTNKIVKVEISDTGIGIDSELTKRIFEPFFTTRPSGTGLGLYFARLVIQNSGGTLDLVRTVVGKGTTFSITIPFIDTQSYEGRLPRPPRQGGI